MKMLIKDNHELNIRGYDGGTAVANQGIHSYFNQNTYSYYTGSGWQNNAIDTSTRKTYIWTFYETTKKFDLKIGVSEIYVEDENHFTIVDVLEIKPPGQKKLVECRGQVINDFQNSLEQQWIASLKESHKKELVKNYIDSRIKSMGLNLNKHSLTLLESCESKNEKVLKETWSKNIQTSRTCWNVGIGILLIDTRGR
jgi:hypothetical protein